MIKTFLDKLRTIQESLENGEKVIVYKSVLHKRQGKCDKYIVRKYNIEYMGEFINQKGNVLDEYNKAKIKLINKELNKKDRS